IAQAGPRDVFLLLIDCDRSSLLHLSGVIKMKLSQCSVAFASFLPNTRIAIGIVLASPDKNSVQPSTFRFPRLNLPASSRPAPNPTAPRVAAISAISGTAILLGSKISSPWFSPLQTED